MYAYMPRCNEKRKQRFLLNQVCGVGQNHVRTVHTRYVWQKTLEKYGHTIVSVCVMFGGGSCLVGQLFGGGSCLVGQLFGGGSCLVGAAVWWGSVRWGSCLVRTAYLCA